MSGKIEFINSVILLVSVLAAGTDLFKRKIYNWLTFSAVFCGIVTSSILFGWQGTADSLLGVFLGLVLFGWMFPLGVMGAGDVKLLMAFGSLGGYRYTLEVAFLSIFVGGAMSLVILTFTGRILNFLRRMHLFLLSLLVKELEVQLPEIDHKLKMPFGVPLAVAAVWTAYAHPLSKLMNLGGGVWP